MKQEKASAVTKKTGRMKNEKKKGKKQNKFVRPSVSVYNIDPEPSETNADGWCLAYELTCMSMCVYSVLHLDNACVILELFFYVLYSCILSLLLIFICLYFLYIHEPILSLSPGSWPFILYVYIASSSYYYSSLFFPVLSSFCWRLVFRYQ